MYDLIFGVYFFSHDVQENSAIGSVVHQTSEILGLIMFRKTFPMRDIHKTSRPGVRCTTSALVCNCCTRGVEEKFAIGLVVLQSEEILGLIICFAVHFLCN